MQLATGQTWTNSAGDNDFSNPGNWNTGEVPNSTQNATINSSGSNKAILSSIINGASRSLRVGVSGTGELDIENGAVYSTTNASGNCLVGHNSSDVGTINQNSGAIIIASDIRIGQSGTGVWNLNNGLVKATRGSFHLGGGSGTFKISGGEFQTRTGVYVYNGGNFIVDGSESHYISLGTNGTSDGFWNQSSGGKLTLYMDTWGVTPVEVKYVDGAGSDGDVTFANGALLDVAFKAGVDISGSWDVMKWDGTITDNGLAFAPSVDQSRWSFEFVDTNSDGKDDTLRVTASNNGTATSNGVPYTWYDTYFSGLSNPSEYENLDTVDSDGDGLLNYLEFRSKTNPTDNGTVSSINDLKKYLVHDNVNIKLAPGTYTVTQADIINNVYKCVPGKYGQYALLLFEGSNSTYDLTNVKIEFSAYHYSFIGNNGGTQGLTDIHIVGSNNHIYGLEFENVDDNYSESMLSSAVSVFIDGHNNLFDAIKYTTRGSFPYGYGSYFGIGSDYTIRHTKHSGLLVRGNNNTIKDMTLYSRTFGHGLFMQGATNTTFDGCYIEGELRTTDDMLTETSGPAYDIDFLTTFGDRLSPGYMSSLSEDGIRAYASGLDYFSGGTKNTNKITVNNCTIKNMRRGVHTNFTPGNNIITNTTALGVQELGFIPSDNDVFENCKGDALYAPLAFFYYTNINDVTMDISVIRRDPSEYYGNDIIAYIAATRNDVTIKEESGCEEHDGFGRILIGGYNGAYRLDAGKQDVAASQTVLTNKTRYKVEIGANSTQAIVSSSSEVQDNGSQSVITPTSYIAENCCEVSTISPETQINAEDFCDNLGGEVKAASEGGFYVAGVRDGNYFGYATFNFDENNVNAFEVAIAKSSYKETFVELRLDDPITGTLIGTVDVSESTGGSQSWQSSSAEIQSITGTHRLYLVFRGQTGVSLVNFNWFKLLYDSSLGVDSFENETILYPNPVIDKLHINNKVGSIIELYSTLGKLERREEITSSDYFLDMFSLSNGIYFIKLKNETSIVTNKIIKK